MVDIQSVAAEIRQGKKQKKKIDRKKLQGKNITHNIIMASEKLKIHPFYNL